MATHKIAITIDEILLSQVDRLIAEKRFPNRSRALQDALREKLERMNSNRLARELDKLDPVFEQQMADEDMGDLREWSAY